MKALRTKFEMCCGPNYSAGFTIIEFLIVTTIAGIMVSIAVPSFAEWIRETRMIKSSSSLNSALVQARNEALRTQARVTLCRTGNVYGNDPDCFDNIIYDSDPNVARDWSYGWLIYTSTELATAYDPSLGHQLIAAVEGGEPDKLVTIWSNSAALNFVTYGADGRLDTVSPVFAVCDDRNGGDTGTHGYRISISATGRPVVTDFEKIDPAPSCTP